MMQENMEHILFYDSVCPAPYSSASLGVPGKIGGAEASVVRVAEQLSSRYRVSVGQHNRETTEQSAVLNLQWLTKKEALEPSLDVDVAIIHRRVVDIPLLRWRHPRARLFVWCQDW